MGKDDDDDEGGLSEVRLVCPMSRRMADDVDRFWHERRMRSKSEAMRHLIQRGLDAERLAVRKKA